MEGNVEYLHVSQIYTVSKMDKDVTQLYLPGTLIMGGDNRIQLKEGFLHS